MNSRLYVPAKKTPTPILKSKGAQLQRRYPDQIQPETASFANEEQLTTPEQPNLISPVPSSGGHSFGRVTVWPAASENIQSQLTARQHQGQYEQKTDYIVAPITTIPDSATLQPMQRAARQEEAEEVKTKPVAEAINNIQASPGLDKPLVQLEPEKKAPNLSEIDAARNEVKVVIVKQKELEVINPDILSKFPHGTYGNSIRKQLFGELASKLEQQRRLINTQDALGNKLDQKSDELKKLGHTVAEEKRRQTLIEECSKLMRLWETSKKDLDECEADIYNQKEATKNKVIEHYKNKIDKLENERGKVFDKRNLDLGKIQQDYAKKLDQLNDQLEKAKDEKTRKSFETKIENLEKERTKSWAKVTSDYEKYEENEFHKKVDALQDRIKEVNSQPITIDAKLKSYKATFNDATSIRLDPMENNLLELNRPAGFARGGEVTITKEVYTKAAEQTFHGNNVKIERAKQIANTWAINEGKGDSLNTWDVAKLTLGPGLAMGGALPRAFSKFYKESPKDFERLFGRFGIGMEGLSLTVVVPSNYQPIKEDVKKYAPGTALKGNEALDFIINDPLLLTQLVKAGQDDQWQEAMIATIMESSIGQGGFSFTVPYLVEAPTPKVTLEIAWEKIVAGLDESIITATYAALADETHAKGGPYTSKQAAKARYAKLVKDHEVNGSQPEDLPKELRLEMAKTVLLNVPNSRRGAFEKAITGFTFKDVGL